MFKTVCRLISSLFLIIIFAILLNNNYLNAENTDRTKAEAVCQRSDVIFCENWEDGDHIGWADWQPINSVGTLWGGMSCESGGCEFNHSGYNSDKALWLMLNMNDRDTMYPRANFNTSVGVNDTIYMRYYVYWSPGFEFNVHGNKNSYLETPSGSWRVAFQARPNRDGSSADITRAAPYVHLYCGQIDVAPGSDVEAYCYDSGGDMRYFPNQSGYEDFKFSTGQWYFVEMMVTPNPVGNSFGGRISVWIDGNLMIDFDNVSVRHATANDGFAGVWFTSYFGGGGQSAHPDQYILYDNIVVSRSYIGAMDNGGGGSGDGNQNTGNDASASGGSGCGYVKDDNGKGMNHKGSYQGLALMILLILILTGITLVRRVRSKKIFLVLLLALLVGCGGGNVDSGGSGNNSGNGNNNSADTAPPSVPTGLFTQSVSTNQVSISWNASTDDNGVAGYRVYRNNAQVATAAGTSYQDANLLPSTTYSYKVAAYDAAGNVSQQSAALNVTTQSVAAACSDNAFSFALFSDNYSGQEGGLRRTLNEVVSKDPNIRFLASAGDTPPYQRVRGIIDAELSDSLNCGASEFPWFPATGNHDSEAQSYMDWWAVNWANGWTTDPATSRLATQLPGIHNFKRGPLQIQTASGIINADHGTMYSFDYKNVHFIYIDNYEQGIISDTSAGAWDQNGSSVFDPAVSQLDWLKDDLEQNTKPITFVFGHVALLAPCYNYDPPISYYNCPGPPPPLWSEHNSNFHTTELTKLLADYNVVAYFHGHDHVPSRMLINNDRTSAFERLYWAAANDPNKSYGTPSDWEGLQGPGRLWQVDGGAVYTNIGEYIIVKLNDTEIRFEIYKYPNNTQGSTELWDTWSVPIAPYCTANGGC